MDANTLITAVTAPAPVSARPAVGGGAYAERMARFDALSSTVLDGSAAEDQRVQAYQSLQSMSASGQLIGIEDDRRQALDQATFDSEIGQRAQQLSKGYIQSVNAAGQSGGASAALKAALSSFDGLSNSDQNILFATTLNAPDRLGSRPYADAQAWRDNTDAQSKIVDHMQASGVVGPNGQLDYRAAAKSDDAKLAAALKLSQRRDNNSPDWTRSVQQLFGASRAPDRVDLSPAAQSFVDQSPPAQTSPASAAPYKAGSLISTSA